MATATHIPGELLFDQGQLSASLGVNFNDTTAGHFTCLLVVAGSGIPSTLYGGIKYVSDVTGTNAELAYSGYARQTLTGVSWAALAGNTSIGWTFSNITWPANSSDPGTGRYAIIAYLGPSGSYADSAAPVVAVLDLGATVSVANGSFTIECPVGGLIVFGGAG